MGLHFVPRLFGSVVRHFKRIGLHVFKGGVPLPNQSKMADGVIPVVDFGVMGLNCPNPPSHDEESVKILADKIHTAFSTIGFVYLTNHGISDAEVSFSYKHEPSTYTPGSNLQHK